MRWEAMSDIPADYRERLDLREQMARLDQLREEALKLAAEQHKLTAEAGKLIAEAAKLKWDRWLAPLVLVASMVGGVIVALVNHLWR